MARTYTVESAIPYVPIEAEIYYPDADGKPMAASDLHYRLLMWTRQALEAHFVQNPDVYISGDIMMYYKEGEPREHLAPDVLVCFGINTKMRRTYKVWEEGKAPDFVMEFSSESTYDKDLTEKMDVYASLEIQDYFLYDPEGLYLPTPLMGYTLVDGVYVAISPGEQGGFRSSVLDLDFHIRDEEIAIYDPIADNWLQTPADRTEIAEARAEQESIARENAEALMEQEATRADTAEAENALLREEIERLKAGRE